MMKRNRAKINIELNGVNTYIFRNLINVTQSVENSNVEEKVNKIYMDSLKQVYDMCNEVFGECDYDIKIK